MVKERVGWEPESENPYTDIERAVDETWKSPFEGKTEDNPVLAAAEALWAVHVAGQQEAASHLTGTLSDDAIGEIIARKDELFSRLSEEEQREAIMHAQLIVGPFDEPESDQTINFKGE